MIFRSSCKLSCSAMLFLALAAAGLSAQTLKKPTDDGTCGYDDSYCSSHKVKCSPGDGNKCLVKVNRNPSGGVDVKADISDTTSPVFCVEPGKKIHFETDAGAFMIFSQTTKPFGSTVLLGSAQGPAEGLKTNAADVGKCFTFSVVVCDTNGGTLQCGQQDPGVIIGGTRTGPGGDPAPSQ